MDLKVEEQMKQTAQEGESHRPAFDPAGKSMDLCVSIVFKSQVRKQYFFLLQGESKSSSFERVISSLKQKYQGPGQPINIVLFKN